ncbi:MAG: hypothetical protein OEY67_10175 [Gammaproteobacteria bacterium]|nr:hypothetical protein [Gammaproteobacteria bacterium]
MTRQVPVELFLRNKDNYLTPALWDAEAEIPVEPAFLISGHKSLYLNVTHWSDKARDYLAHHVARKPNDLRTQIQRINVNHAFQDVDGTYGAVLDLFIVLGKDGIGLRRRVLRQCDKLLRPDVRLALKLHLVSGVTALTSMPPAPRSVLTKGLLGTANLVEFLLIREMRQ